MSNHLHNALDSESFTQNIRPWSWNASQLYNSFD